MTLEEAFDIRRAKYTEPRGKIAESTTTTTLRRNLLIDFQLYFPLYTETLLSLSLLRDG